MGTHLTERFVKAAEIGTRKYVVFDEDCAGFGLCVFLSGRKTFILIYRAAGRQRRMTIGTWPSWSVIAARDEAKRLKRDIDRGEDPMDVRTNARHAPTVDELVDRYIDEHLPKLGSAAVSGARPTPLAMPPRPPVPPGLEVYAGGRGAVSL